MKKIISTLLVLSMVLSILVIGGWTVPAATVYMEGDISGDSNVTTYDARLLMVSIVAGTELTSTQRAAGDLNSDGNLSTMDVRMILLLALNGTAATYSEVSLLAPTVDSWNNPVQKVNNVYCTVKQSNASDGGYVFTNVTERDEGAAGTMLNPYTWPCTGCAYDQKILAAPTARIEYDITVSASAASFNLYFGGDIPFEDDASGPYYISLNFYIGSHLNIGSGDLPTGTYTGSIAVADILGSGRDFFILPCRRQSVDQRSEDLYGWL